MTNPRQRWLFTRQDDPDEYRPGRSEVLGAYRLGHGWTAPDKYTGKDAAEEPSPLLPPPMHKPRARTPGAGARTRARTRALHAALFGLDPISKHPPPARFSVDASARCNMQCESLPDKQHQPQELPMATIAAPNAAIPQTILDLRAKLASSDHNERHGAIAEVVGLPSFKDVPRPGDAIGWDFDRWMQWGKEWNFYDDSSGTSKVLRHEVYTMLFMSMHQQNHDSRVTMNITSKFRREIIGLLESLSIISVRMIDSIIAKSPSAPQLPDDPLAALGDLAKALKTDSVKSLVMQNPTLPIASPADTAAWAALPGLFKTIDKELNMSIRQVLNSVELGQAAEGIAFAVKQGSNKAPPRAALVLHAVRMLLEEKRALIKHEADKKHAERLAQREQKQKQRDPGSEEKYKAGIARTRADFHARLTAQHAAAQSLLQTIQRQMTDVVNIAFPEFPGAPAELIEQNQRLMSERDSIEVERDALRERTAADAKLIAQLEADRIAAQKLIDEGSKHDPIRIAADDLATHILAHLSTGDLVSLVAAITQIRSKATALKQQLTASPTAT